MVTVALLGGWYNSFVGILVEIGSYCCGRNGVRGSGIVRINSYSDVVETMVASRVMVKVLNMQVWWLWIKRPQRRNITNVNSVVVEKMVVEGVDHYSDNGVSMGGSFRE